MNNQNNHSNVNGNGGGKKFLYSGPRKKGLFGDEEEEQQSFSFNTNTHNNTKSKTKYTGSEFDIDSIWSIKKNVAAPKNQSSVATNNAVDGWDRNVGKGFYSRHGGNNVSEMRTTASPTASPSGKTWPRTMNTYNYSYGTSNSTLASNANGASSFNSDFKKIGSGHSNQISYSQNGQMSGNSVHGPTSPTTRHLDF